MRLWAQTVNGKQELSRFGVSVASWGDANGDGFDDVVVGDPNFGKAVAWDLGAVFRFDRSAAGLNAEPTFLSTGKRVTVVGNGPSLGISVAPAGDVDGDGVPDIAVGADSWSTLPYNASGAAFWLRGE